MINQALTWVAALAACVVACSVAGAAASFGPWWARIAVFAALAALQLALALWVWYRWVMKRSVHLGFGVCAVLVSLALMAVIDLKHSAPLVFLIGAAWGGWADKASRRFGPSLLALLMVWAGGWMLNVPAAEAIAQFRAGLFYSTLRDVVITAAPLAEGGEAEIRVSFTVPWSLAPYPQAQWDTMQAHDSWVPYTVPVIFTPVIELGFVERQGVSGRVELGGSVQRERLLIDGVESQSYLLHRAGRYEMLFRWKNHLYTSLDYGRHAKGECFDIALLNTERLRVQQMASDRRFVEPVRVALSSIRFTPNRRLFWGRERLSLPRNAEPSTALGSAEAPFSPFDLALARFKQQDVAGVPECGPSQRLDACLASGEKCEQSDPRPALAAARAGLQAIKPW